MMIKKEKDKPHTCFTCGEKFGAEGGVMCSYHNWMNGIFCSRCFKPRYLLGEDVARVDITSTEIHCNGCINKRIIAAGLYKEAFLS